MTDFKGLLRALTDANVEFILVGGVAATVHGSTRRTPENIARLVRALAPHAPYLRGAPPGLPFRWNSATVERGLNFTLTSDVGDLDLFGEIAGGGTYDALRPHAVAIQVFEVECLCLGLERLIDVKRAAGRPKDLDAVAELEAILEERRGLEQR